MVLGVWVPGIKIYKFINISMYIGMDNIHLLKHINDPIKTRNVPKVDETITAIR